MGLGSGIRKKPITDPGSRGQKGTGSRIRIRTLEAGASVYSLGPRRRTYKCTLIFFFFIRQLCDGGAGLDSGPGGGGGEEGVTANRLRIWFSTIKVVLVGEKKTTVKCPSKIFSQCLYTDKSVSVSWNQCCGNGFIESGSEFRSSISSESG